MGVNIVNQPPKKRRTAQKTAVAQALAATTHFVSAADLHEQLSREGHHVGIATVYRHLNALAADGRADTVTSTAGLLYRSCEPGTHHHHLICENCGASVQIDLPDEDWIRTIAAKHGYSVSRHEFEIFGLCPDCAEAPGDAESHT